VKSLFITATNTDIGKTFTTIELIKHFSKQGVLVGVCKPIETGVICEPLDATKLLKNLQKYNRHFKNLTPTDITAYTFELPSAPFCADTKKIIDINKIKLKIKELEKCCDLLIIEGAGGLFVPITANYTMIDLISELNIKTLLVTPSKLGCINDTLLSIEALKNREIAFDWTVNLFQDKESFSQVTQPFYDEAFPNWWSIQSGLEDFVNKHIAYSTSISK
jgi:dethiobiotin synthetase